jgi:hypothetical protein
LPFQSQQERVSASRPECRPGRRGLGFAAPGQSHSHHCV